ncbi:hypothetical protein LSH36_79g02039 [Paralvinella palmiformis]|uniref:NADH dehydrogenase [ubiquinone] 1 alpha subcomplex subunit 13 n=1 Tax=Paralvinella palmiformis TaxID=53620 RepID=A0AAD9NDQ3_9ANNE|nr:hypothetical protein LSH36_79g02039 [Paralvinella palmiformis]
MASNFRQDMPPPGGYSGIEWARRAPRRGFGGYATFGIYAGISVVGLTLHYFSLQNRKKDELEMREGRIAIHPLILAERQRMFLKQLRKNRDEENELMKSVPGWETGTLWGEPVYHNLVDRFPWVNPEEYFAHASPKDMYDRIYEKRHH